MVAGQAVTEQVACAVVLVGDAAGGVGLLKPSRRAGLAGFIAKLGIAA